MPARIYRIGLIVALFQRILVKGLGRPHHAVLIVVCCSLVDRRRAPYASLNNLLQDDDYTEIEWMEGAKKGSWKKKVKVYEGYRTQVVLENDTGGVSVYVYEYLRMRARTVPMLFAVA